MFLVENLPKESSESASEPLGKFLSKEPGPLWRGKYLVHENITLNK